MNIPEYPFIRCIVREESGVLKLDVILSPLLPEVLSLFELCPFELLLFEGVLPPLPLLPPLLVLVSDSQSLFSFDVSTFSSLLSSLFS